MIKNFTSKSDRVCCCSSRPSDIFWTHCSNWSLRTWRMLSGSSDIPGGMSSTLMKKARHKIVNHTNAKLPNWFPCTHAVFQRSSVGKVTQLTHHKHFLMNHKEISGGNTPAWAFLSPPIMNYIKKKSVLKFIKWLPKPSSMQWAALIATKKLHDLHQVNRWPAKSPGTATVEWDVRTKHIWKNIFNFLMKIKSVPINEMPIIT